MLIIYFLIHNFLIQLKYINFKFIQDFNISLTIILINFQLQLMVFINLVFLLIHLFVFIILKLFYLIHLFLNLFIIINISFFQFQLLT